MKFFKFISVILHPIVIPTIGVILYFILIPNRLNSNQRFLILGLIFITTYIIPLIILILFKKLKLIKSFKAESIRERKIPVAIMIVLFYLLGNILQNIPNLRDLGLLFYATSLGLVFIYVSFAFKLKASLHLLSLGLSTSFFIILGFIYARNFILVISVALILSGVLASSRLYLKAHKPREVYIGFFFGFIASFAVYYLL